MSDNWTNCGKCGRSFMAGNVVPDLCSDCDKAKRDAATITRLSSEAAALRADLDKERNANAKVELALYDAKAALARVTGERDAYKDMIAGYESATRAALAEVGRVKLVVGAADELIARMDEGENYSYWRDELRRYLTTLTPPAPQQEKPRED